MTTPLLGCDAPSVPTPVAVDLGTLTIKAWMQAPKVAILMSGWLDTLDPRVLTPAILASTGPCERDVQAWQDRSQEAGAGWGPGSDGCVPITSLVWALEDLAGRFPAISLDAGMAWALATVGRRGSIVETVHSWFEAAGFAALERGWLFEAAGLDLGEVARMGSDEVEALDDQVLVAMAGLRGVPLPSRRPKATALVFVGEG